MKKAASFITALCIIMLAVAPVTVKAAAGSDQIYYITRQANINNQIMIDNGYNTAAALHFASTNYCVNSQIDAYNAALASLPVDLSDYDYYYFGGQATTVSDDETGIGTFAIAFLNTDQTPILINSKSRPDDFYYSKVAYENGVYTWGDGNINLYLNGLDDLILNDDFVIYDWDGSSWTKRYDIVVYSDCYYAMPGYITSTNFPAFYYGKDIWLNNTANYTANYSLSEWKAIVASGIENSDNLMESFQVTADGTNYESWGDAFGDPEIDLNKDTSLAFSSCDCTPIKNGYSALTDGLVEWTIDTGSFDFTFGGDNLKQAAAANKWGVSMDVSIEYRIIGVNGNNNIAGSGATGTIYSHIDNYNLTQDQFLNGDFEIDLLDLALNGNAYSGGDAGAYLMAMYTAKNQLPGLFTAFNGHLVSDAGSLVEQTAISWFNSNAPDWASGIDLQNVIDFFHANQTLDFEVADLRYDVLMYPVNTGLGIEGQKGEVYCDLTTGVHNGRATGAIIPDGSGESDTITRPDYNSGDNQNYYSPVVLPGGGNGFALSQGSPTSSSNSTANGGNANVTVNANPVITIENGVKEFAQIMSLTGAPKTLNNSIWGAFGYFKDNPAIGLYREYFGSFPEEFRNFILACATICFGIGVWRFVRGRSN